ncbi:hypothetical protein PR048_008879 [Dryococelus australis]|uniref:Cytochrome P450 n=1 Tax=Dryococelus australis TaxID=614101 RepID=A0ABQ9HYC5_9NEOP|nr:hypothetical protein PR048_008879 [Dryococelus australis]
MFFFPPESIRKYPPLSFLERVYQTDCKFEGTDIVVGKGTVDYIPVHAIHYDQEIFPDLEKFDPEKFNADTKRNRSHFAYLPFGEGPRQCIAKRR